MTKVYLGLGSNVGDSRANIARAIMLLAGSPAKEPDGDRSGTTLQDIKQAPVYTSKAVGYTEQADFLNTAIRGQTELSPQELLARIEMIEQELGRLERFRWGPREIDIDIILYGDRVLESEQLTLPHPHFRERDFVLRPLADLDPRLVDPVTGKTVEQLLIAIDPSSRSIQASTT
jgi:2-amino-4-hydroxy-6-hydroxymethyldihydropteridine diphosphokinase